MNHAELAAQVAEETGLTTDEAHRAIRAIADVIAREVAGGGRVAVSNFATFRAVDAPKRRARNPQTGGKVTVPARRLVRVTVSPRMQEIARAKRTKVRGKLVTTRKRPSH